MRQTINPLRRTHDRVSEASDLYTDLDSRYVNLTGDTMTGSLIIQGGDIDIGGKNIYFDGVKRITDTTDSVYTNFRPQGATLILYDGASNQTFKVYNSAGSKAIVLYQDTNAAQISSEGTSYLSLQPTSGNVGIGTTNPTYKLYVNDTNNDGNGYLGFGFQSTDAFKVGRSNTSGNLEFTSLSLGTDYGFDFINGNVGIGTTAPGNKLAVTEASSVVSTIPALGSNGGTFGVFADGGKYGLIGGALGSGSAFLQVQRVDSLDNVAYDLLLQPTGGNVGIGTTSPGQKLEVTGGIKVTGNIASESASAGYLDYWSGGARIISRGANANTRGTFKLITDEQDQGNPITPIEVQSNGNVILLQDNIGKVGIGTLTPGGFLHVVNGTANTQGDAIGSFSFVGPNVAFSAGGQGTLQVETNDAMAIDKGGSIAFGGRYTGTQQANWAGIRGAKETATDGEYGGYLSLGTRPDLGIITERLRITSAGNIGIGTTSPGIATYSMPLTVQSSDRLGTFIGIRNTDPDLKMGGIWLQENTSNAGWLFGTDNDGKALFSYGSGASEKIALDNAKDSPIGIVIDTTGNVGIGTTNPGAMFEVSKNTSSGTNSLMPQVRIINTNPTYGNYNSSFLSVAAGNGTVEGWLTAHYDPYSGSGVDFRIITNHDFNVWTNDIKRMTILAAGNVGIGTVSPNANAILDITSTTKAFMPPRMTTTQKAAIATPTAGMVVFDSDLMKLCVYTTAWETITSS